MRLLKPSLCLLLLILICVSAGTTASAKGSIIFNTSFSKPSDLASWSRPVNGTAQIKGIPLFRSLHIAAPDTKGALIQLKLPAASLRGTQVEVSYRIKGTNISSPPQPWSGVKVMLHATTPSDDVWPQQNLPQGTFSWMKGGFSASIPADADSVWLIVGLQSVSGTIQIDGIRIDVVRLARIKPAQPITVPALSSLKPLPERLRGVMISTKVTADDLRTLASWGANSIRWQLTWDGFPHSPADTATLAQYNAWLQQSLAHLDSLLPLCRQLGLHIALDLHTPPGGRAPSGQECNMFQSRQWQQAFLAIWKKLATRYSNEPAIWAFDLVNEPQEGVVPKGLLNWPGLAQKTAELIRSVDSTHWIIFEASPGGGPVALAVMEPLKVPGVVYSIHMYEPSIFTHQGIGTDAPPISYPGPIGGKEWNKEALRKYLHPVRAWQQDYNARIYVGEFSAIRWAPGESAHHYLRDCIELFEEWGWDWTYHAFREWNGWSVEHSDKKGDEQPSAKPTSRELLLKRWFGKNER